jgi:class 3 adenylate cyclase
MGSPLSPDNLAALYAAAAALSGASSPPSKLTRAYEDEVLGRLIRRRDQLDQRVDDSTQGRVIPGLEQLLIGEGKHFELMAVLFLDICKFSERQSWTTDEQKDVLKTLNIFMGEMLTIVRDYDGHFEKNTGDGLMAYFGEGASTLAEAVKPAVECAVMMHYVNDNFIGYFLKKAGFQPIQFRVGIDVGPITLAKVAITGGSHGSILAIGTTANLACKIMRHIPDGGISIGAETYANLPNNWKQNCKPSSESTGHIYRRDRSDYPAWILDYRAPSLPSR